MRKVQFQRNWGLLGVVTKDLRKAILDRSRLRKNFEQNCTSEETGMSIKSKKRASRHLPSQKQ